MKHTIVHHEIPADDVKRAQKFYMQLFGWKFSNPPGYDDYWSVEDEQPTLGIAMMERQSPEHGPTNYFGVESLDEAVTKVEQLSGKVIMPKSPVPGMGWFAHCQDSEGNIFALWQDDSSAA